MPWNQDSRLVALLSKAGFHVASIKGIEEVGYTLVLEECDGFSVQFVVVPDPFIMIDSGKSIELLSDDEHHELQSLLVGAGFLDVSIGGGVSNFKVMLSGPGLGWKRVEVYSSSAC